MSGNNANEQGSVSDAEQVDPEVTEIMDVIEQWVDTENIDLKFECVGPQIYSSLQ